MKFSVIIPVYNVAPYLRACLDSVCAAVEKVKVEGVQWKDRPSVEVLCVDDGSTDGSGGILDEYACRSTPTPSTCSFRVLHQQNAGVSAARNAALEVATGDWICFVDADDVVNERLLEAYACAIREHAAAELVAVGITRFDGAVSPAWSGDGDVRWRTFDCGSCVTPEIYFLLLPACAFKSDLIRGLRFRDFRIGEDRIFLSQVIERLHKAAVSDWIGYAYRQRTGSACHSRTTAQMLRDEIRHHAILTKTILSSTKTYLPSIARNRGEWLLENFAEVFYGLAPADRDQVWDDWLAEMKAVSGFKGVRPYMRMVMRLVVRTRSKALARILVYGILWLKLHGVNRRLLITKQTPLKGGGRPALGVRRICYVVDGINFIGGAHVATANLLSALKSDGVSVDVLTDVEPDDGARRRFAGIDILRWHWPMGLIARTALRAYQVISRSCVYPDGLIDRGGRIRNLLSDYDCVCVMSETSPLRGLVVRLPSRVRKVQMIHNDYLAWRGSCRFARWATGRDKDVYANFDRIALVGQRNAAAFAKTFPGLRGKVSPFQNVLCVRARGTRRQAGSRIRVVTVARCDEPQKGSSRSVRIAERLLRSGIDLEWTFIGPGYERLAARVAADGLGDRIRFPGAKFDAAAALPEFDVLALFSHFEGLPMVICEAQMQGLPVAATDVGGVGELVVDGRNGWLFQDDEDEIVSSFGNVLRCRGFAKMDLDFTYDREAVIRTHRELLGLIP